MFRDCKTGGYNIEGTGLRGERLIKMILLMAIVYSQILVRDIRGFRPSAQTTY